MAEKRDKFRLFDMSLTEADKGKFAEILRKRWPDLCVVQYLSFTGTFRVFAPGDGAYDPKEELTFLSEPLRKISDDSPAPPGINEDKDFGHSAGHVTLECGPVEKNDFRDLYKTLTQKPIDWHGTSFNSGDRLLGRYQPDDPDMKKFVSSVFYYAKKFTSDWYQRFDLETGKKIGGPWRSYLRTGPDTIRKGLDEPDFYPLIYFDDDLFTWIGFKAIELPDEKNS